MKREPLLINKIGYAFGDVYGGGAFLLLGVLYLIFLTDIVGLDPALAGSIFLIGKVWDGISDPLMGIISDRTKSRFGRRRIYFLVGIIPIFLSFTMLWFTVHTDSQLSKFGYYLFSYLFFSTTATLVMIPYSSILPAMTSDYKERTSFITIRLMFSNISAIVSGVLPMIIVNNFSEDVTKGYLFMGIFFGLFYALPYLFVFWGTYENDYDPLRTHEPIGLGKFLGEFKSTFKNRSFRTYSILFIASQTAVDFVVTLFIYYLTYCLGIPEMFSLVLGTMLIVQVISMPIHMKISHVYGKVRPLFVGLPVWITALLISVFLTAESPLVLIFLVAVLSGFGCSASIFVPWSIFPDLADVDELITGQRREGIYSGLSTLIRKISQALALFMIGLALDIIGYVPNVSQTADTELGIKVLFGLSPILFIIITLVFARRYTLTEEKYEIIQGVLSDSETEIGLDDKSMQESVCEEVTGLAIHELKGIRAFD